MRCPFMRFSFAHFFVSAVIFYFEEAIAVLKVLTQVLSLRVWYICIIISEKG